MSRADELAKLADLRDRGLLTDEEFDQQKARVLNEPEHAVETWASSSPGHLARLRAAIPVSSPIVLAVILAVIVAGGVSGGLLATRSTPASHGSYTPTTTGTSAAPTTATTATPT